MSSVQTSASPFEAPASRSIQQPCGNDRSASYPATGYKERIGYFLKHEVDEAIRQDEKGFKTAVKTLVDDIGFVKGDDWSSMGQQLIQFQEKWRIAEPKVREGVLIADGINWNTWQTIRKDTARSGQRRFKAVNTTFLSYLNAQYCDGNIGFASMQRVLWSVWRVVEYLGLDET